jgi:ribonuclease HII
VSQPDFLIGADEVGTGAWAGPAFVCAVAVPYGWRPPRGLTDSKLLQPFERARIYGELAHLPMVIRAATNAYIDKVGLGVALHETFESALRELIANFPSSRAIVDGNAKFASLPEVRSVPKADLIYPFVSAASVIAKVNRDLVMRQYHDQYPFYGWKGNVGYGTPEHREGLRTHGVSPLHRRSYRPIKELLR